MDTAFTKSNYRPLGQTGIEISPLGLGTVKFGRNQGVKYPQGFELPDEPALADLLALAKGLGINMLDTAPAYGLSEERLGRLLAGQRDDWVIVGKAGEEFEDGQSRYDFSADHVRASLERSLKRLKTDYLDVLLLHSDGSDSDILADEELMQTMMGFKARGLVRAIGLSVKTVEGGLKAVDDMDVVMCAYNPEYTLERPVLDKAAKLGKAALIKKALASGHAGDPAASLKFALNHSATSGVIVGTINPDNLKANCSAALAALRESA